MVIKPALTKISSFFHKKSNHLPLKMIQWSIGGNSVQTDLGFLLLLGYNLGRYLEQKHTLHLLCNISVSEHFPLHFFCVGLPIYSRKFKFYISSIFKWVWEGERQWINFQYNNEKHNLKAKTSSNSVKLIVKSNQGNSFILTRPYCETML